MKVKIGIVASLLGIALTGTVARAQSNAVPQMVNYQGRLLDGGGNPVTGEKQLQFHIYGVSTSGNPLWGPQTFQSVQVGPGGYFNVLLGPVDEQGTPRPLAGAFTGSDRFLAVRMGEVGGTLGPELAPRQQVLSAPYSFTAANASNAANAQVAQSLADDVGPEQMKPVTPVIGATTGEYSDTNSPAWTDVPGLSITLTTHGRPVYLTLRSDPSREDGSMGDGDGDLYSRFEIRFLRDGSVPVHFSFVYSRHDTRNRHYYILPPTAFNAVDLDVPAGNHSYKVQWRKNDGDGDDRFTMRSIQFVGFEF